MNRLLKQATRTYSWSLRHFAALIDHCLSTNSLFLSQNLHAQLIKSGFNGNSFLGNRCLDLYFKLGVPADALKVFDDITDKNTYSWNICLKGLLRAGDFSRARYLFDEIPERDVVCWNSMISGSGSCGFSDYGLKLFCDMQKMGVMPSEFTFSILMSLVWCDGHGRQVHGNMIRMGLTLSNVVLGNSLIDMYGRLGLLNYAFGVFMTMEELDVISWNSFISCCSKCGLQRLALSQFGLMRSMGYEPDEYTVSLAMSLSSDLRDLEKGKQVFALCVKTGFVSNTIVSSAIVDMFSKCNRFLDSIQLSEELDHLDSALCNSIMGCYATHGHFEDSLRLFMLSLKWNLRPTHFTISTVLSSISALKLDGGNQIHSLTVKLGLESDLVVASSMVEMYNKSGFADSAMKIFETIKTRDLISWNSMILGLAQNGKAAESLKVFHDLLQRGPPPDEITALSALLACCYGGFVDEAINIFSLMEEKYQVKIDQGHYACIVDVLCRVGMLKEALDIVNKMPLKPSSLVLEPVLRAPAINRDLETAQAVAETIVAVDPQLMSPYLVLAKVYESTCQWENLVRVRYAMNKKRKRQVQGHSWIVVKNHVHTFVADQSEQHGREDIHSTLRLLTWEMEIEDDNCLTHEEINTDDYP